MKVVIVGGCGFLGGRLAEVIQQRGSLLDHQGKSTPVSEIVLLDQAEAVVPLDGVTTVIGDITDRAVLESVIDASVGSVFHLAAVVSSAAEADFDLGMQVNIDGTRHLLECCRQLPHAPKFVYSSSVAAFGDAPAVVEDDTPTTPQSSYGTQKVVGEFLVNDYSRKGYIDGRGVRLPTVSVRPGKPNKAASSFVSGILREPLQGQRAICPVTDASQPLWISSPAVVIENLLHAHETSADDWSSGPRTLNLPGLTVTIKEMVAALERAGGDTSLLDWAPDTEITRLVKSWPGTLKTTRADSMGFKRDTDIDSIVQAFITRELGGKIGG